MSNTDSTRPPLPTRISEFYGWWDRFVCRAFPSPQYGCRSLVPSGSAGGDWNTPPPMLNHFLIIHFYRPPQTAFPRYREMGSPSVPYRDIRHKIPLSLLCELASFGQSNVFIQYAEWKSNAYEKDEMDRVGNVRHYYYIDIASRSVGVWFDPIIAWKQERDQTVLLASGPGHPDKHVRVSVADWLSADQN